jgi:hypothetical protein
MRTITPICALLLLTSCNKTTEQAVPPLHIYSNPDDSSPIIISDGSIQVQHYKTGSHFRIHGPKHADLKLAAYQLTVLGYGCDPTKGTTGHCNPLSGTSISNCTSNTGNVVNTSACQFNIDPTAPAAQTSWQLSLCDTAAPCASNPNVTLGWDTSDYEKVDMKSTSGLTVTGDESHGPVLKYATNTLSSARLTVTTTAAGVVSSVYYDFDLSASIKQLEMAYDCRASGNVSCKP